jgi:hypothetical protein
MPDGIPENSAMVVGILDSLLYEKFGLRLLEP